jgi:hypothetical protein
MSDSMTLVDAHVHVYPQFNAGMLLASAHRNFLHHARAAGASSWQGVLLLAETSACDWFLRTRDSAQESAIDGWHLAALSEDETSMLASGPQQQRVFVVAGRQINTIEGIEVLTLASTVRIADAQSLEETLRLGLEAGAIVVLPWGAGKWLGHRARLVKQALHQWGDMVFTGDNGGRPWIWPRPALFAAGEGRGRPVLPGTDPLPLAGHEHRVGAHGFMLRENLRDSQPGLDLRGRLVDASSLALQPFGRRETLRGFVRDQVQLRLP